MLSDPVGGRLENEQQQIRRWPCVPGLPARAGQLGRPARRGRGGLRLSARRTPPRRSRRSAATSAAWSRAPRRGQPTTFG